MAHVWKVDLASDFDATEAESEALKAGSEAIAEIASFYERRFSEFVLCGDETASRVQSAANDALKRGESPDRIAAFESFARSGHLAGAVGLLPRKRIGYEDFSKLP